LIQRDPDRSEFRDRAVSIAEVERQILRDSLGETRMLIPIVARECGIMSVMLSERMIAGFLYTR
jgi:hypothetical protein